MWLRRVTIALVAGLLSAGVAACTSPSSHPAAAPVEIQIDTSRTPTPTGPPVNTPRDPAVLGRSVSVADSFEAAGVEDQFFALANAARAGARVVAVARDPDLDAYARAHVRVMALAGRIYHSNIESLLGPWWMVGENVGVGPSTQAIETAYERSPSHFRNITESQFKYVGVGVVVKDGRIYTAEVFGI